MALRFANTLFGRLVIAQFVFGAIAATGFFVGLKYSHGHFHLQAVQAENIELAVWLLREERELFGTQPRDLHKLEDGLIRLSVLNPMIDLYWLDPSGRILASSVRPERLQTAAVDMTPLASLLSGRAGLPVLASDPAEPATPKVFSVAGIGDPSRPDAYLYAVLRGGSSPSVTDLRRAHVFWESLALVSGVMALALFSTLVIVFVILRPFRRLSRAMGKFQQSDFTSWIPVGPPRAGSAGSDLDRLTEQYDEMARRIAHLLGQLRDDDRKMREMFANISHDLRTPLTIIQGNLETLQLKREQMSPGEQASLLDVATAQTRALGRLVASVFELAKLQSPHFRLRPEPFSLAEMVQDVALKFALPARESNLTIVTEGADRHARVLGDIALIERALDNLVTNAVTHAAGASVVRLCLAESADEVEVAVTDNGSGISDLKLAAIERAREGLAYPEFTSTGSGLGLLIVRRILALHGAALGIETRPGEATTFRFSLRKVPAGAGRGDTRAAEPDRSARMAAAQTPGGRP